MFRQSSSDASEKWVKTFIENMLERAEATV